MLKTLTQLKLNTKIQTAILSTDQNEQAVYAEELQELAKDILRQKDNAQGVNNELANEPRFQFLLAIREEPAFHELRIPACIKKALLSSDIKKIPTLVKNFIDGQKDNAEAVKNLIRLIINRGVLSTVSRDPNFQSLSNIYRKKTLQTCDIAASIGAAISQEITTLDLSGLSLSELNETEWKPLIEFFQHAPGFNILNLSRNYLNVTSKNTTWCFFCSLIKTKKFSQLILSNNNFDTLNGSEGEMFCAALEASNITSVVFGDNELSEEQGKELEAILEANRARIAATTPQPTVLSVPAEPLLSCKATLFNAGGVNQNSWGMLAKPGEVVPAILVPNGDSTCAAAPGSAGWVEACETQQTTQHVNNMKQPFV